MSKAIVIVPTYNEADNIINIIERVLLLSVDFNILVVDDNSPDNTGQLVSKLAINNSERVFLLSRNNKEGLGKAYTEGFIWALCISNFDLVIGSRYIDGINVVNWPLSRIILSYFASFYSRIITGMPVKDATSGFVGYRAKVLKEINLDSIMFNGYAFQIELKFKAYKKKFKIQEIPIIFKDRVHGESKMNGNIIFEAIFGLILMRFKSFCNK